MENQMTFEILKQNPDFEMVRDDSKINYRLISSFGVFIVNENISNKLIQLPTTYRSFKAKIWYKTLGILLTLLK